MPLPWDGDLLSDPSNEGRSKHHHKRRKLEQGESSRSGELNAQVKRRAYNLRPRRDEPLTMRMRSEFVASRNKQKELRESRQKKLNEYADNLCDSIQKILREVPTRSYKDDMGNRTEISGVDPGAHAGTTKLFACSGTVVEFFEGRGLIVTVANLVKSPGSDEVVDSLKIDVYLQNHELLQGELLYFDFYHNICVIQIKLTVHLPIQTFNSKIKAFNFTKSYSGDVVTLGRDREIHVLLVSTGKIIPKSSKVHCEEFLVSTCRISKGEVGGPLIDFTGYTIGMNYYDTKETPFIPGFIMSKCLQQFKISGKVVRPWHGLRVRTLYAEECSAYEKLRTTLRGVNGVIIEKIEKQSSVRARDLNEGDVINRVNGVYFSTAAELCGILLDIGIKCLMDGPNNFPRVAICLKFGVRGCEREGTVVVNKSPPSHLNRWPFPKPIIVRQYCEGELVDEKWYTTEY